MQDESCFGNRERTSESVVHRRCRRRGIYHELHRSNDLCDHGMRGHYGKERRYADPPRASKL